MVQLTVTGEARSWTSMDSEGLFCACFLVFLRLLWLIWMFYPRCSVFFFVVVFFAVVVFCFWLCQHFIACSSKKSRNPVYQTIFFCLPPDKTASKWGLCFIFFGRILNMGLFPTCGNSLPYCHHLCGKKSVFRHWRKTLIPFEWTPPVKTWMMPLAWFPWCL